MKKAIAIVIVLNIIAILLYAAIFPPSIVKNFVTFFDWAYLSLMMSLYSKEK